MTGAEVLWRGVGPAPHSSSSFSRRQILVLCCNVEAALSWAERLVGRCTCEQKDGTLSLDDDLQTRASGDHFPFPL